MKIRYFFELHPCPSNVHQMMGKYNLEKVTFQYENKVKSMPDKEETSKFFKLHF